MKCYWSQIYKKLRGCKESGKQKSTKRKIIVGKPNYFANFAPSILTRIETT